MLCEGTGEEVDLLNFPNFLGLADTNAPCKFYLLCSPIGVQKTGIQNHLYQKMQCLVMLEEMNVMDTGQGAAVLASPAGGGECIAL